MINITKSNNGNNVRDLNPTIFSTPVQIKDFDHRKISFHKNSLHNIDPFFNGSKSLNDQQTKSKGNKKSYILNFQKLVSSVLKKSADIDTQRSLSYNSKINPSLEEKFYSLKSYGTVQKESSPKKNLKNTHLLFNQINQLLYQKNKSPLLPLRQSVRNPNQQEILINQIQKRNSIIVKENENEKRRNTTQNGRQSMKEYSVKNFYAVLANQNKKNQSTDNSSFTLKNLKILNNSQQQSNYFSQNSQTNSNSKLNSVIKQQPSQHLTIHKQFSITNEQMLNELYNRVKNKLAMQDYEKQQWKLEKEQLLSRIKKLEEDLDSKQQEQFDPLKQSIFEQSFG